ncbi:MAG: DUF4384 domain-containing protein [Bacteroides sp.]|nr:DUF4384 domain-containing protein [Bacteroides sp.]
MKRLLSLVLCIIVGLGMSAQKIQKISATYTYYAPETMSVEEAKRIAIERAKIKALSDAFGTVVAQNNSSIVYNNHEQSESYFSSHGETAVKGEWLETIGTPKTDVSFEEHSVVVTCTIDGKARNIVRQEISFEAMPLRNAPNTNYSTTEFSDGDDLYLYFRTPVAGYLNIFLISSNDDAAYCLLPYKHDSGASFFCNADTEYFFFSKQKAYKDASAIDEYCLSASAAKEFNDLMIIFSPAEFYKGNLKSTKEITRPKMTTISKFNDWLTKLRTKNETIQISKITLTITKR